MSGLLIFLFTCPVFAQNSTSLRENIWISPLFETNFYSITKASFGGGAAFGYGDGASFGLRVFYCYDFDDIASLELSFLLRLYLPSLQGHSGFFLQFAGGPVLFARNGESISAMPEVGTISIGLSAGWRFLIGRRFFVEPAVRAGYPYIVGAGLSAGLHF